MVLMQEHSERVDSVVRELIFVVLTQYIILFFTAVTCLEGDFRDIPMVLGVPLWRCSGLVDGRMTPRVPGNRPEGPAL